MLTMIRYQYRSKHMWLSTKEMFSYFTPFPAFSLGLNMIFCFVSLFSVNALHEGPMPPQKLHWLPSKTFRNVPLTSQMGS